MDRVFLGLLHGSEQVVAEKSILAHHTRTHSPRAKNNSHLADHPPNAALPPDPATLAASPAALCHCALLPQQL